MDRLHAHIPMDRRFALIRGEKLPDRTTGAALFADISGFTALTDLFATELGRKRGAEEVLRQINPVYEAIIAELHRYAGSVIGFAGDAITCWFDDAPIAQVATSTATARAVACALAMQEAMSHFTTPQIAGSPHPPAPSPNTPHASGRRGVERVPPTARLRAAVLGGVRGGLGIKIGIAAGSARRFLVGDPTVQVIDALAGLTLERMALAERQAKKGEVLVSEEVVEQLGDKLAKMVAEWRVSKQSKRRFAVLNAGASVDTLSVPSLPWPTIPADGLSEKMVEPWLVQPIYERLRIGNPFLAELRPVVPFFLKLSGINYEEDDAEDTLDSYVSWVQAIVNRYDEGTLVHLTIGDKGCYLFVAFGAPIAHHDDPERAIAAALELQNPPPSLKFIAQAEQVQIGITQGQVWAGVYGAKTRHTYSVIGNAVNMAARLMNQSKAGQILVHHRVAVAASNYRFRALGEIMVKGRATPLAISEVVERRTTLFLSSLFNTPLVGRSEMLRDMLQHLSSVYHGNRNKNGTGQVVRLSGSMGIGKSHLTSVFSEQARQQGWHVAIGFAQSISRGNYYPWRQILRPFFSLPDKPAGTEQTPLITQIKQIIDVLTELNPAWPLRAPLLGDALGLYIPDNLVTAAFQPRLRQESLFTLVIELIQRWAKDTPLLLLLEDTHWMDEASRQLTIAVARALPERCMLLLIHRPLMDKEGAGGDEEHRWSELEQLPHCEHFKMGPLSQEHVAQLLTHRLQHPPSPLALSFIHTFAQGNPFFSKELADTLREASQLIQQDDGQWVLSAELFNRLRDNKCLTQLNEAWVLAEDGSLSLNTVDLNIPDSVHGMVLARIDRLSESNKLTLKVASVIGRKFMLYILHDIHPTKQLLERLIQELQLMKAKDFLFDESAMIYLFKHHTTKEVAYDTLLFAQRKELHRQVANWYERAFEPTGQNESSSALAPYYPLLVYHWHHAEENKQERTYAELAGKQAATQYANEEAIRYFTRAIELTPQSDMAAHYRLLLAREAVYDRLGEREAQAEDLVRLAALAKQMDDLPRRATITLRQANYAVVTSDYPTALAAVQRAVAQGKQAADVPTETKAYLTWGKIAWQQGEYDEAKKQLEQARTLAQQAKNQQNEAESLLTLANVYWYQGNHDEAQSYCQAALAIHKVLGNRQSEAGCLSTLGAIQGELGDYVAARHYSEQALTICQTIGYQRGQTIIQGNLGADYYDLGDYKTARNYIENSLKICKQLGDRWGEAIALDTLGLVCNGLEHLEMARQHCQQAIAIQQEIGDQRGYGYTLTHLGHVLMNQNEFEAARKAYHQALELRRNLGEDSQAIDNLAGLAHVSLMQGDLKEALEQVEEILEWIEANGTDGIEYAALVYLTCYKVLSATSDARAKNILIAAHHLLTKRATEIQDEQLRRKFLENVPFNREIMAASP